jgi:hypothetical protein
LRITQYWFKGDGSVAGSALSQVDTVAESNPTPEYNELSTYCYNRFIH